MKYSFENSGDMCLGIFTTQSAIVRAQRVRSSALHPM